MDDTSQYIAENESSIKLHEVENQYDKNQQALQIWTEALPATKIFNHELEMNLIANQIFDGLIESTVLRDVSRLITFKEIERNMIEKAKA